MIKKYLIGIVFVLAGANHCLSQVIRSEKSYLKVNNLQPGMEKVSDHTPPEIVILSPLLSDEESTKTDEALVNLVGRVFDSSGINSVIINTELAEVSSSGVFTAELILSPGNNEFVIMALDRKNNLNEKKITLEYVPAVMTFVDKIKSESVYYGLIIGVDNYEDPSINNLDNPIRDAEQLYQVLLDEYLFLEENIYFLRDASREEIITSLDELALKITPNDNLLIFYAGHGWWDQDANNGYWLPSDARQDNKTRWFRNSALVDYLKEIKSKHTLLIADACFGGAIFQTRSAFLDNPQKAIERLYELPSRKAMTSGTLTEVPDRSAFIRFLIERLENNPERYLSSEQLFSSFRIAVINNSDVVPQYGEIRNVGDQGGDFIFIRK